MIYFVDPDGTVREYGGSVLILNPERRILYNPITSIFCRLGEQARAKAMLD